jgi:ABC-2 type transport system ATP-binding protein
MVELHGLRKEFGRLVAVNDLSFRLEPGDAFGFIGPNGAGKTTTIRMLATLLQPTAGTATVDGHDIVKDPMAVRAVTGYMPDFFGVYDDVKVWEYLDFFAAAHKVPRAQRPQIVDDVLELTDLVSKRDNFVEELSRGMKQRLCLAKTLVHDPKVLLLDEPASGLDPRARIEIKELIKELRNMGKTILVSSHILPELAGFCNKIAIIEQGRLVVSGPVEEITRQVAGGTALELVLQERGEEAAALLRALPDVKSVEAQGNSIVVQFSTDEVDPHTVLQGLMEKGFRIRSFRECQPDLEDVFMKVTRGIVS